MKCWKCNGKGHYEHFSVNRNNEFGDADVDVWDDECEICNGTGKI